MQNLLLAVSLNESNWGTFQVGDERTNNIVRAYFGQGGQIGANPATVNTWFSITGTADLSKDLWFEDLADDEATADVREDHALDAALVYYHTHQAMRVYRRIGAPVVPAPGGQPLQVITFSNNPTAWPGGATIFINEDDSAWNNGEAPKNREWHEFSHYMMWRVYGRMPPLHAEADDINGNGFLDADVNHGGYWYNMMSSSDAIVEGFAVFMAMVIADQMEQDGEIYMNDHVPPYIYPIGTGAYQPAMCNLEINYPQNRLLSLPADYRRGFYDQLSGAQRANAAEKPRPWRAIADEDLSVASTLWDVYDGQSSGDQDEISVDLQALWPVWAGAYQVPQYFAAPTVGGFLGDAFTYGSTANPSRWRDNSFVGERRRNAPFPIVVRNIWYIIDLYTALTTSLPGQRSQIDQVFRSHKIYLNTFREFADSTTLQMDDLVSFGDPGSTVSLSVSPEAAHEFWSEGIVADLDVAGWGAGFTVNQEPYVDARGYLYIWIWVNAPEGTAFDIVVEDDEGQWLCSGTSEALYGMDDPPEEWRYFQRGTGRWSAYSPPGVVGEDYPFVAVLRPSPAEEDWRHVYDFRPNPNHKTPPGEVSGPDLSRIHGIGVLFTDPGSYQAMVGSIVLTADYPWKPGMTSIVGIGDPALALFRPYRRNTPPVPGSKARIQLNEAPATLLVSLDYAPPYEDLSFTYPLTVDNTTEEIYLFVEPPLEGGENTITIAAESEDYETEETFTMTSTEFWSTLEEGSYVANVSLELVRKRWDPGSLIGTAAGAGVLGLCCCLPVLGAGAVGGYMLLRRREKRSAPPAPPAPPAPTTVAWGRLSISEGPSASRTVWLDKPVLIIGRSSSADLVLQDPLVSGRHAQLRWQDGVAILDDLRSTNGTLVNGQRVTSSHAIRPGDVIQMGHTKLLFQRADHRPS
jgi:hypothetical protein